MVFNAAFKYGKAWSNYFRFELFGAFNPPKRMMLYLPLLVFTIPMAVYGKPPTLPH